MNHCLKYLVCLLTLTSPILTSSAYAQATTDAPDATPEATSAPVAYVYVTRPTHLDAFAVSSAGKLTAVPGSPFANIDL